MQKYTLNETGEREERLCICRQLFALHVDMATQKVKVVHEKDLLFEE